MHNTTIGFKKAITGDSTVGLILGGRYDGSQISRMSCTNVTFEMSESLDGYHGALQVVSANASPSHTVGNVSVNVMAAPQFGGSVELENGVRLEMAEVGEFCASELTAHDGVILRYKYASSTTSVIRVTSKFEIPESGGKVYLSLSSTIADSTSARDFPLLIVPDSQELSKDSFVMCGIAEPTWATGELVVIPDETAHTKTLAWRVYGSRKLVKADSTKYASDAATGAALTSALSEGQESQWSPEELPSEGNVYAIGQATGYGTCLRTPWGLTEDYVFPGKAIKTIGSQAYLILANNVGFTADIATASRLYLMVYNGMDPTLSGRLHLGSGVTSTAYNSSVLTVASDVSGTGNWNITGYSGTSSPNAMTWFTGDNSQWNGVLSVQSPTSSRGLASESYHQKIGFGSAESFGGRLDALNYKAMYLKDYTEMIVDRNLTMADGLNRGVHVLSNMIFNISADCTFNCNWPVTLNGRIIKKGNGTLALGGPVRFVDDNGETTELPPELDVMHKLDFRTGAIKALRHDSVNGMYICGTAPIALSLDFNPSDADLKRYGFYNVKTENPFAAGKAIKVTIENVDRAALDEARLSSDGYKQGLVTVKTSVADEVEGNLTMTSVKGLRVIREDDPDTGLTTFSAYGKIRGTMLLVK